MSTNPSRDIAEVDRELLQTAAIGLAVWLAVTMLAVAFLFLFGETLTNLFV